MEICKQQSETEMRLLSLILIYGYVSDRVGVANFFLGQSISID